MTENKDFGLINKLIEIEKIENGTIFLKNGGLRKILLVSGMNFALKSEEEQQVTLFSFQNFINSLDFPVQININSRKLEIAEYLESLEKRENEEKEELLKIQISEYRNFIKNFVGQNAIMDKAFFVVVPYDPIILPSIPLVGKKISKEKNDKKKEDLDAQLIKLNQRIEQTIIGIRQLGLRTILLQDNEILNLFENFYSPALGASFSDFESIIPNEISINPNYLKIDNFFVKNLFILNYPRYLFGGWLSLLINLPEIMDISIHIFPADTSIALKNLRKKSTEISIQIAEAQQKGLARDPMLETAQQDIENLRDSLQQAQEKLFSVGVYVSIYAENLEKLNSLEERIIKTMESQLITVKSPVFEQLKAFNSVLPIGCDKLDIRHPFNTSPLSSFFPFASVDLTSDNGILYGVNLHNNTLVIFDRFSLENANTVIFAKAGSGKSYATKLEIIRSLMFGSDILIIDPENEYQLLAESLGGTIVKISLNSEHSINPLDIPFTSEDEDPGETLKSHFVNLAGLLKIMLGEISPREEALIDRAITETYALKDIIPGNNFKNFEPPLLKDLESVLANMEGGKTMADKLYRFTSGSYAGFTNKPTNVDIDNRLIVFSIRDLEEELRPIAMYVILNFIWAKIRSQLKKRIVVIDEAWWLMKYQDSAAFLFGLAKRARKYYLGVTTITQDVEDFLNSPYGRPIITNSSLQLLLKQSPATIDATAKAFGLSEAEKNYLLEAGVGQGLFLAGLKHAAIYIKASDLENYIITTDPAELAKRKELEKLAEKENIDDADEKYDTNEKEKN